MCRELMRSVCRGCHGGCGVLLTVDEGRLTDVAGDPDSPFNRGAICVKGKAAPEIVYHPDRLRHPLKRKGDRGSGRWQQISWDQALDEISERLGDIRLESGPETVAIGQGTGRHHYLHVVRFANCFGTPNWYEPGLAQCFHPRITVSNLTYGALPVGDYLGEVSPRTILFWGHNPLISGPDGELSFPIRRTLAKGSVYGIAVDPRRSETARRCKLWLPIRPGTDAALALAMIHVIISEQLHDTDFVADWCVGFKALARHVEKLTPEWASNITGVPPQDIAQAARVYATRKPGILDWGVGLEQNANSTQTVRAVAILRAITGNIDVPGGDILGMGLLGGYPVHREHLPRGIAGKRLGRDFSLLGGSWALMPSAHIPALVQAMLDGEPYRVRALLLFGSNPLVTVADGPRFGRALDRLDLLVAVDLFMTPSAERADYVLPAAYWPEIDQVVGMPFVAHNAILFQRKCVDVPECRPDEWILDELARRLELPGADERVDDCLNQALQQSGIGFGSEEATGAYYPPHRYRKYLLRGFRTLSRKVELYSTALERMGYDPLPTFREPPEDPVSSPHLSRDFPLVLITGARRLPFFHSEHRQIKSLRMLHPEPRAEIHPETAEKLGVEEDQWIAISSAKGRIVQKAHLTLDIRPDVVSVEHGWWFPEEPGPDHGVWRSNANVLTSQEGPYDPCFGSYQLRGLPCRVDPVSSA